MSKNITKELYFFRECLKNLPKDTNMEIFCKYLDVEEFKKCSGRLKLWNAKLKILKTKFPEYFV